MLISLCRQSGQYLAQFWLFVSHCEVVVGRDYAWSLLAVNSSAQCFCHAGAEDVVVLQIALDDISLDDLWALDLNKLDGWHCVKENTTGDVKETMDSDGDSDSSDSKNDSAWLWGQAVQACCQAG